MIYALFAEHTAIIITAHFIGLYIFFCSAEAGLDRKSRQSDGLLPQVLPHRLRDGEYAPESGERCDLRLRGFVHRSTVGRVQAL